MPKAKTACGDCLQKMKTLPSNSVDSVVTDPPYGLAFMGKRWDYDVPSVDIWQECLRILKPGGHLLAFAGTRTQHRMAVRIEDAGFELRDMIAWVYGSGFPKSLNVSKAIDKAAGAEREVVGFDPTCRLAVNRNMNDDGWQNIGQQGAPITVPSTEAAKQWAGWGTALKPALEPITVARKPFTGTVAANVLEHGTGAINVDGCRVGTEDNLNGGDYSIDRKPSQSEWVKHGGTIHSSTGKEYEQPSGRWPANLIHDGSDEVVGLFPESNGQGSADRFFYCAKTSKKDRGTDNNHPTVKPTELMKYLCRLVTPPNGTVLDPFMGSGSTGKACMLEGFNFIGIEFCKEYYAIARNRIAEAKESL